MYVSPLASIINYSLRGMLVHKYLLISTFTELCCTILKRLEYDFISIFIALVII